jgi:hypothetical protein
MPCGFLAAPTYLTCFCVLLQLCVDWIILIVALSSTNLSGLFAFRSGGASGCCPSLSVQHYPTHTSIPGPCGSLWHIVHAYACVRFVGIPATCCDGPPIHN